MTIRIRNLELHEYARYQRPPRTGHQVREHELEISGQESFPGAASSAVALAAADAIRNLVSDEVTPVTFDNAAGESPSGSSTWGLSGLYRVTSAQVSDLSAPKAWNVPGDDDLVRVNWTIRAERVGSHRAELESRLTGGTRSNSHATTSGGGEIWHAPPPGVEGVGYGSYTASTVARSLVDGGTITVYRDIPDATPAVYSARPYDLEDTGNVTVTNIAQPFPGTGGLTDLTLASESVARLANGLLELQLADSATQLAVSDGVSAYESTYALAVRAGGTNYTAPIGLYVLRNTPHVATIRAVYNRTPRLEADWTIRRGAHHAVCTIRSGVAETLGLALEDSANTGTADQGGWIERSADDTAGHRWLIGTAGTVTKSTSGNWRFLTDAAVTEFTAYVGYEVSGSTAQAGDTGADVLAQFIEDRSELVKVVRA